jgi:hypothetical protein
MDSLFRKRLLTRSLAYGTLINSPRRLRRQTSSQRRVRAREVPHLRLKSQRPGHRRTYPGLEPSADVPSRHLSSGAFTTGEIFQSRSCTLDPPIKSYGKCLLSSSTIITISLSSSTGFARSQTRTDSCQFRGYLTCLIRVETRYYPLSHS